MMVPGYVLFTLTTPPLSQIIENHVGRHLLNEF